jgi:class III cytochrome C family protein
MKTKKSAVILTGVLLILSTLLSYTSASNRENTPGTDVILIDAMKVFEELERPAVAFQHDLHTSVLEKRGKDCSTCHLSENDELVVKFGRLEDKNQETTLDVYHGKCIACHEENDEADLSTGPVECGECHVKEPAVTASQKILPFDESLHYRHIQAQEGKCDSCHHGYNSEEKKKIYVKGEEESCRSCHQENAVDDAVSYRLASHQACISCHQETKDSGPVACSGCHDEFELQKIERVDNPPRLDRNQPDRAFLKGFDQMGELMMNAVLFNHIVHENSVDSCRTCHHETLEKCENCHSLSGKQEGGGISLPQATHDENSEQSCVGCHSEKLKEESCVGCHSLVVNEFGKDTESCGTCHTVPLDTIKKVKASQGEVAAEHFKPGTGRATRISLDGIPETIEIGVISHEYKGASFPHKTIIETLMEGIKGDRLAEQFHQGENVVCASCHHNSPDDLTTPPRCISCHSASGENDVDEVPALKDAYHQQCFSCHDAMKLTEPASADCTACHEEK